jgi:hypothetical protein
MTTADKPDYTKERIKFETEFFKQLMTVFIVLSTGTVTWLVKLVQNPNLSDGIILVLGGIATGGLLSILRAKHGLIYKLINDLNSENNE